MASNKFSITVELDPIVKLYCRKLECRFHMMNSMVKKSAHCMLKYIDIDKEGKCEMLEQKEDNDKTGS